MAVTVVPPGRLTAIGVLLLVVVPLPSWPKPLSPQAQAEPETTAIDPAAWVPIGDPEMIVPDSASIAASPSAAGTRGPFAPPRPSPRRKDPRPLARSDTSRSSGPSCHPIPPRSHFISHSG